MYKFQHLITDYPSYWKEQIAHLEIAIINQSKVPVFASKAHSMTDTYALIKEGYKCIPDIARERGITYGAVSKHIANLVRKELVIMRNVKGKRFVYPVE